MTPSAALLAQASSRYAFADDGEFWIAIVLGSLSIVLGLRFFTWMVRSCLDFAERKQMLDVLNTLAKQGRLEPERLERVIEELSQARRGGRRATPAALTAAQVQAPPDPRVATRDRAFRCGFVLLATSLGFFAASIFSGEAELMIPACIAGGIGFGLSGMGVARHEALDRIRRDVGTKA